MGALIFLVAALAVRGAAHAGSTAASIKALDTNGDGHVSKSEVAAFAHARGLSESDIQSEFASLDLDADGELSAEEIARTLGEEKSERTMASEKKSAARASSSGRGVAESGSAKGEPKEAEVTFKGMGSLMHPASKASRTLPVNFSALETLRLADVKQKAQMLAGRSLAEAFARSAAESFDKRSRDEEKAVKLEKLAASLRGKAEQLIKSAREETAKAAAAVIDQELHKAEVKIEDLEAEAHRLEDEASQRRSKAKTAMERAQERQAAIQASLR
mmetsp:Transcript_23551/g.52151  ORF Transcript_23551/g.52151 Transcript_23551/m.52151 type:complete len:274 (+) Transcript_23551:69-890(+)